MIRLLAQTILAIRNEDAEGWMNTLVVVLLVVCWAVWGVLRSQAKKAEAEDDEPIEIGETAISRQAHGVQGSVPQQSKPNEDTQGKQNSNKTKTLDSKSKKKRKAAKSSKERAQEPMDG